MAAGEEKADPGTKQVWEELIELREQVRLLTRVITEKAPPAELNKVQRRKAVYRLPPGTADTAACARVGKAARRNGMSYKDWVALHGPLETNPP